MFERLLNQISDKKYVEALSIALGDSDEKSIYIASLLMRKLGLYSREKGFLTEQFKRFPDNEYIRNRIEWHNQPLDKILKPRPRFRSRISSLPTFINDFCIVTGGSSSYFPLLYDCILSVKNTLVYGKLPIYVIDCGLTDSEKHILYQVLKVDDIFTPNFDLKEIHQLNVHSKTLLSEPFLPKHSGLYVKPFLNQFIKKQRYAMWIDADAWVQDESALDDYVLLAAEQPIAISNSSDRWRYIDRFDFQLPFLESNDKNFIAEELAVTTSIFVVDLKSEFNAKWAEVFSDMTQKYGFYRSTEYSSKFIMKKMGYDKTVDYLNNYGSGKHGFPVIYSDTYPNERILYLPHKKKPIGVFHICHPDKFRFFYPTSSTMEPLNEAEEVTHRKKTYMIYNILSKKNTYKPNLFTNQTEVSLRYNDWPHEDLSKEFAGLSL